MGIWSVLVKGGYPFRVPVKNGEVIHITKVICENAEKGEDLLSIDEKICVHIKMSADKRLLFESLNPKEKEEELVKREEREAERVKEREKKKKREKKKGRKRERDKEREREKESEREREREAKTALVKRKRKILIANLSKKIIQQDLDLVCNTEFKLFHDWDGGNLRFLGCKSIDPFEDEFEYPLSDTKDASSEASDDSEYNGEVDNKEVKGGELLFCGTTEWDGSATLHKKIVSPTRLAPLMGIDIHSVASGCDSSHCVALDIRGRCYTWGRNEKGQLGHGDTIQRDMPTIVAGISKLKITKAGAGRSHTVVVTEDGLSYSFGWNKHGQLGLGTVKDESSPVSCLSNVKATVCGADFTVWLTSEEGSSIMTAGLSKYGQLGHGSVDECNRPMAIASLYGETIVKVACGTNHTVAVDKNGYVYTWGYGDHGRLGHGEQKNEFAPRRVDVFRENKVLPPGAVVSAGAANSACTAGDGQLYMWGKIPGAELMNPEPLAVASGWDIRCMDSGSAHHFVGTVDSCFSWSHTQSGELGSSAVPQKIEILDGMPVLSVACGRALSLVVVDRTSITHPLERLEVHGKAAREVIEEPAAGPSMVNPAAKSRNSKKRKKDDVDEEDTGQAERGEGRGKSNNKSTPGKKGTKAPP